LLASAEDYHPTILGQKLAQVYQNIIAAQLLLNKKVLVIDLDNTLWKGTIGDGDVEHFTERQCILKRLRHKGFLLAVSSKNDAENVTWQGAALSEEDFAVQRIDWNPKSGNIRAMAAELNLGLKEFVFIDDMPVERTLVKEGIPEITVLDATLESTWDVLEQLTRIAVHADENDRTQMYREKRLRDEYLRASPAEEQRHRNSLRGLELQTQIFKALPANAGRIAELINRTNQFNINGTRTTDSRVLGQINDSNYLVLYAKMRDRFGDSGLVCCAIVALGGDVAAIESFVLSCRAFGFGIETALMNDIKAQAQGVRRLIARYKKTDRNQACRSFLPDHGFTPNDDIWVCDDPGPGTNPEWLKVECGL
jgi:FkbH-like protein